MWGQQTAPIRCSAVLTLSFNMKEPLYEASEFSSADSLLGAHFQKAFETSILRHQAKKFVTVYSKQNHTTERTFKEFSEDVLKVKNHILAAYPQAKTIATKAGNTYEHLVYIVAILLAGYSFCPLSPRDLASRTLEKINQLGSDTTELLEDLRIPETNPVNHPVKIRSPHQGFIYIFTSGTTGYSKVVHQTELGVMTNVEAMIRHHEISEKTVIGTPLPIFHVNALEFSFLGSLLGGGELILFEEFQPNQVFEATESHRIQILSVVPHLLKTISDQIHKLLRRDISNFKYFVTAAAPVSGYLLEKIYAHHNLKIIQGYGLSEAINFSLTMPIHLSKEQTLKWYTSWERPSVGTAVYGNDVFILRDNLTECDPEEIGEVCIRGPNVMKGYKDQDMTSTFRGGFLHTGDQGFFKTDPESGNKFFFICGRLKDICKRAGVTVSLVEVDDLLQKWAPTGVDLISFYFENVYVGEEIAIAINNEDPALLESLIDYCENNFSSDMRPRYILPTSLSLRTESGKPLRWKFKDLIKNEKQYISGQRTALIKTDIA